MLQIRRQSSATRLFSAAAYRQPTAPQRDAQRESALERQRATAATAQHGNANAAPAFPAKDPAKQRPLLAGQRMIDIRVSTWYTAMRGRHASTTPEHIPCPCVLAAEQPLLVLRNYECLEDARHRTFVRAGVESCPACNRAGVTYPGILN